MMMVTFVHFPRVLVMHLVIEFLGHLQEVRPDQSAVDVGKGSLQHKLEEELRIVAKDPCERLLTFLSGHFARRNSQLFNQLLNLII
mgnify:FL=1